MKLIPKYQTAWGKLPLILNDEGRRDWVAEHATELPEITVTASKPLTEFQQRDKANGIRLGKVTNDSDDAYRTWQYNTHIGNEGTKKFGEWGGTLATALLGGVTASNPASMYAYGAMGLGALPGNVDKIKQDLNTGQYLGAAADGILTGIESLPSLQLASKGLPYLNRAANYFKNNYTVAMPTNRLYSGFPLPQVNKKFQVEQLPGYMIKSLMEGSPLSKQLSKDGMLSLKNLQQWIGKSDASTIDKELLTRVLNNHSGEQAINYNQLRREVQGLIPKYTRVPQTAYEKYGIDALGMDTSESSDYVKQILKDPFTGNAQIFPVGDLIGQPEYDFITKDPLFKDFLMDNGNYSYMYGPSSGHIGESIIGNPEPFINWRKNLLERIKFPEVGYKTNTFTFESPGITGNTKHYDGNPIGHSRTYTTVNEPDILHVMESQSDWAQTKNLQVSTNDISELKQKIQLLEELPTKKDIHSRVEYLDLQRDGFYSRLLESYKDKLTKLLSSQSQIPKHLKDNYVFRQIQENLRYAAENGQTKMRYPTLETAAKIEGYQKSTYIPESQQIQKTLSYYDDLYQKQLEKKPTWYHDLGTRENFYGFDELPENEAERIFEEFKKSEQWEESFEGKQFFEKLNKILKEKNEYEKSVMKEDYIPQYQTILKKYADFPKQYQKLFRGSQVRTVTDAKGNTWYEVDVPEDMLTRELQFKCGGKLPYILQ